MIYYSERLTVNPCKMVYFELLSLQISSSKSGLKPKYLKKNFFSNLVKRPGLVDRIFVNFSQILAPLYF